MLVVPATLNAYQIPSHSVGCWGMEAQDAVSHELEAPPRYSKLLDSSQMLSRQLCPLGLGQRHSVQDSEFVIIHPLPPKHHSF